MSEEVDLSAFQPKVGKSFITPHVDEIPTGTVYQRRKYDRSVILIALTPEDVGTLYIFPGGTPGNDEQAIPVTTGVAFLDARGDWYLRHTGATAQRFRVIDAGGAGNAQAIMSSAAPAFANLNAKLVPVTWGTPTTATIGTTSIQILAENTSRRALKLRNASTGGQRMTLEVGGAAVIDVGGWTYLAGEADEYAPLDCVATGPIQAVFSAAGGVIEFTEGT